MWEHNLILQDDDIEGILAVQVWDSWGDNKLIRAISGWNLGTPWKTYTAIQRRLNPIDPKNNNEK